MGRHIALNNAVLFCGGLGGVMEMAAKGAREAGGLTVGLLPGFEFGDANPYIDIAIPTGLSHARNILVVRAAMAVIAVEGSYGTLSEIALALKIGKPVIGLQTWDIGPEIIKAHTAQEAVEKALHMVNKAMRLSKTTAAYFQLRHFCCRAAHCSRPLSPDSSDKKQSVPGVYHTVQKKESLWKICKAYGVSLQDVAELNNIKDTSQIKAGRQNFHPRRRQTHEPFSRPKPQPTKPRPKKLSASRAFLSGPCAARSLRNTAFTAASNMTASISKRLKAPLSRLPRKEQWRFQAFLKATATPSSSSIRKITPRCTPTIRPILSQQGQTVTKGQKIAEVGGSPSSKPQTYLHFQIRCDNKPRNPRFYLPKA